MVKPPSSAEGLPQDWLGRVLQVKTINATLLTMSIYLVALGLAAPLFAEYGKTVSRGAIVLLVAMAIMWAYHIVRILWWRRKPEKWPPVSGWGIVNDRQAFFMLAFLGVVGIGFTAWKYYSEPRYWTISLVLWILVYLFIVAVCAPGIVVRRTASRIARKYTDQRQP